MNESVTILGTPYTIRCVKRKKDAYLRTCDGYVDCSTKTIIVRHIKPKVGTMADCDAYMRRVLRHEIIHAFFYESGLWSDSFNTTQWAMSEEMTDWMALQALKLHKAFEEAGAL